MMKIKCEHLKRIAAGMSIDRRPEMSWCCGDVIQIKTDWLESILKDGPRYIHPHKECKKGKRMKAHKFMKEHEPHEVVSPVLKVWMVDGTKHAGELIDGRHRYGILRDAGADWITCSVMASVGRWLRENGLGKNVERKQTGGD